MKKFLVVSIFFAQACLAQEAASEKFVLMTMLYNEKKSERVEEYKICMEKNLAHELIDSIYVLYDIDGDDGSSEMLEFLKEKGVEIHFIKGRATYGLFFELANFLFPNRKIIVSNADIYFNQTLNHLADYDLSGKFLALTRWNVTGDNKLALQYGWRGDPLYDSHDAWIFETPLPKMKKSYDIRMGIIGCDVGIAYRANAAGLRVINPCKTIQACHVHASQVRNWKSDDCYTQDRGWMEVQWTYLKRGKICG